MLHASIQDLNATAGSWHGDTNWAGGSSVCQCKAYGVHCFDVNGSMCAFLECGSSVRIVIILRSPPFKNLKIPLDPGLRDHHLENNYK